MQFFLFANVYVFLYSFLVNVNGFRNLQQEETAVDENILLNSVCLDLMSIHLTRPAALS